jgi:hypothetical protein
MDELKRVVYEEPQAVVDEPGTGALASLVEDALFMMERMELRLGEYQQFRERVRAVAAAMAEIGDSRRAEAVAEAPNLVALLQRGTPLTEAERAEAAARAEAIRQVAAHLEQLIGRYKELALDLARAYRDVKGDRAWVLDEAEAQEAAALPGVPAWSRWLPPSPHRERIVRWLQAGRAHLIPAAAAADGAGAEAAPLVQFQDGGLMRLPDVRWSEDIRNFYSTDAPPHPHGLLYRRRVPEAESNR